MPQVVTFSNGSTITYLYTADGRKLRTVHVINGFSFTTDYCGNVIYENGTQKLLLTEEGYVDLVNSNTYYYYLKDHQGNNRVVVSSSGTVMETNHYYPFGGVFSTSTNVQPYKYNGKELDSKNGLNWYDYGARHYDAVLGRWFVVDPLVEKYYSTTPYGYCLNNPILLKDPTGKEGIKYTDENGNKIVESNIVILLEAKKVIPENATNKQISKINKQNNRIEKRNAAKIASAQNKLNEIYNGADGKGSKNSNGEFVRFKFNVIGKETNDLSGGSSRDLLLMSRTYGLKARTFGHEDIARAPIVTNRTTGGALGLYRGNSISMVANAPDITLAHEVGHSLWLDDSYPNNKGSLMDYPPTNILIPSDVDLIWEKAKYKY